MKGLELPVNSVIIIAIALLVLVTVSAFFLSSIWQQSGEANAQRVFSTKCQQICTMGSVSSAEVVEIAKDTDFLDACQARGMQQGISPEAKATYCVMSCNCEIDANLDADQAAAVNALGSGNY